MLSDFEIWCLENTYNEDNEDLKCEYADSCDLFLSGGCNGFNPDCNDWYSI